jgi:signal transduction histidine kinase
VARIRLASLCNATTPGVRDTANEVGALIDRANGAIRSLAAQLAPDVLHELVLAPALDWLAEEIDRTFNLKVHVFDDGQPKPLAQEARSVLYRAVRELLINVAKHAQTDSANVESECRDDTVVIRVSDSGCGYDAAVVFAGQRRGLGLISLHDRLSFIGGTAEVSSTPGQGTIATLTAPLTVSDTLPLGDDA